MLAMIMFHNTWDVDGFSWVSFGEGAHFAVAEDTLLMREIQDLDQEEEDALQQNWEGGVCQGYNKG